MKTEFKRRIKIIFTILIFTSIPIITCFIMCLKDGIHIDDVYLANSKWNDELFYYKMIEGTAKYGKPLGYFGYNGSTAKNGTFGPWSPLLFIFYIIYAKIGGWSILSPIHCNIILITIAMAIFAWLVQPTKKQTMFICLSYCSYTLITRYIFSCLPEISIFALLIIFLGVSVKLYRQLEYKSKIPYMVSLNVIAFLLVLMRPYWFLLFLVPGYLCWKKNRKTIPPICEAILALLSIVIYFFIVNNFCAAYIGNLINTDWLKLLFVSPPEGIYNVLHILVSSIWRVLQDVGDGIVQGSFAGSLYAVYLMIIAYALYSIFKTPQKKEYGTIIFISLSLMLIAVFYLYDVNIGSRHIIGFILMFSFLLPLASCSRKECILFSACFIWFFSIRATDQYTYQIPEYTIEKEYAILNGYEELTTANMVKPMADNPWDNTLIWLYSDETAIDFTYLYAVPEGIGINLCLKDYIITNFAELKPKYILTNIGEEIDLLCEQEGKELISNYGNVHIWQLRQ